MNLIKAVTGIIILSCAMVAQAGQSCEGGAKEIKTIETAIDFSQKTIDKLEALNAPGRLFIVGRIGQDLSKYDLKYSHGAYVYKEDESWIAIHELNGCGTASSSIYHEGLANFFLDDMFEYEASVSIVDEKYSKALMDVLKNNQKVLRTHSNNYNLLAYPYSTKYQNSNGWLLETMMQAIAIKNGLEIHDRDEAQGLLKTVGYTGTTLEINALTRLGARISKANVAFDDQPFEQRMQGHITTVTYDGMLKFFQDKGYINYSIEVK